MSPELGSRALGVLSKIRRLAWLVSEEPLALTFCNQRRMPPAPQSSVLPTKSGIGQGPTPSTFIGPLPCLLLSILLTSPFPFSLSPLCSPLPSFTSWAEISIKIYASGSGLVKERRMAGGWTGRMLRTLMGIIQPWMGRRSRNAGQKFPEVETVVRDQQGNCIIPGLL